MLAKLLQTLQALSRPKPPLDLSRFQDPIALTCSWDPLKRGSANFRTHRLVEVDLRRMEFRATWGALALYGFFGLMGLLALVSSVHSARGVPGVLSSSALFPAMIGLGFVGVSGALFYFGTVPIVFDRSSGWFWKGRTAPDESFPSEPVKISAQLSKVHAIQIVSEWIRGKSSFYSYEINLVLHDGSRVHAVDHGNLASLRQDARTLATFLGKPLWDATDI